jgi:hypothetical protein
MLGYNSSGSSRSALLDVIRQVRSRWRTKLALRGVARFLVVTVLVLIASAYALETLRFSPAAILAFRIIVGLAVVASAAWFIARPLMRRVSDEQVALYLEEHEPTLQATIITAMDAEQAGREQEMSPTLVRRLIEAALERCHEIEQGRRVERRRRAARRRSKYQRTARGISIRRSDARHAPDADRGIRARTDGAK